MNFGSTEKSKLHVLSFQSSAARSQACAAQTVQSLIAKFTNHSILAVFRGFLLDSELVIVTTTEFHL
jgi:hypothetical protein